MRSVSANAKWALLSLPMVLTLAMVFAVPIGCLILLSFFSMTGPAQVGDEFSLENYRSFVTDPFYHRIILNTFWLGGVVVFFCLIVGYPVSAQWFEILVGSRSSAMKG
jgi:putative spermidine/putrescine transport system permease protein